MGIKYLVSRKYTDPQLGIVHLRVLRSAVRFSARWKAGAIHITIPAHTTYAEYDRILASWRPKLLSLKPAPKPALYYDGYTFKAHDWAFIIRAVDGWRRHFVGWERVADTPLDTYIIKVSPLDDLSQPSMQRAVGKAVLHVAALLARSRLIAQAQAETQRLALVRMVRSWSVGRGLRRMGCCKSTGDISLSASLMFFTAEQRRSIITHELAHLTHFNHSSAFYALWDTYLGYSHTLNHPDPSTLPIP